MISNHLFSLTIDNELIYIYIISLLHRNNNRINSYYTFVIKMHNTRILFAFLKLLLLLLILLHKFIYLKLPQTGNQKDSFQGQMDN